MASLRSGLTWRRFAARRAGTDASCPRWRLTWRRRGRHCPATTTSSQRSAQTWRRSSRTFRRSSRTFRRSSRTFRRSSRTCPWSRAPSVRCCDGCRLAPLADGGVLPSALTARASRACADLLLQVEQEALAIEPAAVSGQASVGADKPVAGHDDADRITRVRVAHGPTGAGHPEPPGELAVADRRAVRNAAQRRPHSLLERRARQDEGQVEIGALTGKVGGELARGGRKWPGCRVPGRAKAGPGGRVARILQVYAGQSAAGGHQGQFADRAGNHHVTPRHGIGWAGLAHEALPETACRSLNPASRRFRLGLVAFFTNGGQYGTCCALAGLAAAPGLAGPLREH